MQAVVNKDCVMGTAWNGRPYQLIVKDKAPLGVAWDNAILRTSWWAIPKGAKHQDNAMKLLKAKLYILVRCFPKENKDKNLCV